MGIGLNLCRSIVESHQGRMQAENIYNGAEVAGCRFSFWIPLLDPALRKPRQCQRIRTPRGDYRMSLIPKKGTVYVVDDDEAVRDSLQWLLEGKDYRVRCFDSAESFLARFDPREVACLIVDIRMGGMTGLELQDRLLERKSPAAHRLHHRPRRRADGGEHDEEGRDGFHPEALQGRRTGEPGRAHARPRQGRLRRITRAPPAATRCCPSSPRARRRCSSASSPAA